MTWTKATSTETYDNKEHITALPNRPHDVQPLSSRQAQAVCAKPDQKQATITTGTKNEVSMNKNEAYMCVRRL